MMHPTHHKVIMQLLLASVSSQLIQVGPLLLFKKLDDKLLFTRGRCLHNGSRLQLISALNGTPYLPVVWTLPDIIDD
ncbi:hypothetical protein D3C78_1535120 [compost metagenome]